MWHPTLIRSGRPLYVELADAIAHAVRAGELAAGDRLPPQRAVAKALGVNLTTVTRAYALAAEMGVVTGEVGRGTFVRLMPDAGRVPWPGGGGRSGGIDMSSNFPSPTAAAPDILRAIGSLHGGLGGDLLRYQADGALASHLAAGADWLADLGLELPADRLLMISGAIHGVFLSLLSLCRAGDAVLMEELTSPALIGACSVLGLRCEGLAMDQQGVLPAALDAALARGSARVVVLVPNLQNPTLAIMSAQRRGEIAAILRQRNGFAIEDDAYGALVAPDQRLPPLAVFAPERVCYVTSLSKAVAPGLRVGFLAVPPSLRRAAVDASHVTTWMTSPLLGHIAAQWIGDGTAGQLAGRQRDEARRRQDLAAQLLPGASFNSHPAAIHIWLRLPDPWRAEEFALHAAEQGVMVLPSAMLSVGAGHRPAAVRISLCNDEEPVVRRGLMVLAALLRG